MSAKVVTALLMSLFSVQAFAQNNVIDEVVWVVGDEAILKSDVETERMNAQYEGRRFDGDPYCVIPEQLAVQKLFLHQDPHLQQYHRLLHTNLMMMLSKPL